MSVRLADDIVGQGQRKTTCDTLRRGIDCSLGIPGSSDVGVPAVGRLGVRMRTTNSSYTLGRVAFGESMSDRRL